MKGEMILKTIDMIKYLESNGEHLDDWTRKFLTDVNNTLDNNLKLSKKQYHVLVKKSKDIFIQINSKKFENAINVID